MSAPDISLSCNREDQARAKAGNGPQLHRACHDATNGRVDRERPVASALLNRRDLAHLRTFPGQAINGNDRFTSPAFHRTASLEFTSDDKPSVIGAIAARFGRLTKRRVGMDDVSYEFGGEEFVYYDAWDEPCLISCSAAGTEMLGLVAQDLGALDAGTAEGTVNCE